MKSNSDIKKNVEAELRWAPDVDDTDIAVNVTNGVVALTGFTRHYSDKYRAEAAVKRVAGVLGVANDIEVRIPSSDRVPDPELARNAVSALRNELPYSHESVKAVVREGHVTLEGTVNWQYQRDEAERAVRGLKGVTSVNNQIHIKPRIAAEEVRQKIEAAFLRNAQLDARHVSVEANGDEVILRGKVRSWAEKEEAQRTAWSAPGVARVKNEIDVSFT